MGRNLWANKILTPCWNWTCGFKWLVIGNFFRTLSLINVPLSLINVTAVDASCISSQFKALPHGHWRWIIPSLPTGSVWSPFVFDLWTLSCELTCLCLSRGLPSCREGFVFSWPPESCTLPNMLWGRFCFLFLILRWGVVFWSDVLVATLLCVLKSRNQTLKASKCPKC